MLFNLLKQTIINMSYTEDQVTARAIFLEQCGDDKKSLNNFQSAYIHYLDAYKCKRQLNKLWDFSNSELYLKIIVCAYNNFNQLLESNSSDLKIPKICAKLYLKIMEWQHREPKFLDALTYIKALYYSKANKHEKAIQSIVIYRNIVESNFRSNNFDQLSAYMNLGIFLLNNNKSEIGIGIFEKCKIINEKNSNINYFYLGKIYYTLGWAYSKINKNEKTSENYIKFLNLYEQNLFNDLSLVSGGYFNLGLFYSKMNLDNEAIENLKKCKSICRNLQKPNLNLLSSTYDKLSQIYGKMKKMLKSLKNKEKCVEISQSISPDHPELESKYQFIIDLYTSFNNFPKALEHYEKYKNMMIKKLHPDHEKIIQIYACIGILYHLNGLKQKALEYYEKLLNILENIPESNKIKMLHANYYLGLLCNSVDKNKALGYFEKCTKILDANFCLINLVFAIVYIEIGEIYLIQNDNKIAIECFNKYLNFRKDTLNIKDKHLIDCYFDLAISYKQINEKEKALELFGKCAQMLEFVSFSNLKYFVTRYLCLGDNFLELKENLKAIDCYKKSVEINKEYNVLDDLDAIAEAYTHIIRLLIEINDKEKIAMYYKECQLFLEKKSISINPIRR